MSAPDRKSRVKSLSRENRQIVSVSKTVIYFELCPSFSRVLHIFSQSNSGNFRKNKYFLETYSRKSAKTHVLKIFSNDPFDPLFHMLLISLPFFSETSGKVNTCYFCKNFTKIFTEIFVIFFVISPYFPHTDFRENAKTIVFVSTLTELPGSLKFALKALSVRFHPLSQG
jgi:hypothetical protein